MKKGIIMEQHRKYTIVMTRDGLFEKAHPIKDVDIGFEVDYEPLVEKQWFSQFKDMFITTRAIALACVFLIAFLPFYIITNSNETYAYVDIDINPSIELEINNDYEVLGITPFNEDAAQILTEMEDLKGKKLEEAIDLIINKSEEKGLVNTYRNVVIGVHYLKGIDKNPIDDMIKKHFASKPSEWEVITVKIPEEVRELAEEKRLSMNEVLVEQVQDDVKVVVSEEDSEVLESFFHNKKVSANEITEKTKERDIVSPSSEGEQDELIEISKEEKHPSELKGRNGEVNSNKDKFEDLRPNRDKTNDHFDKEKRENIITGNENRGKDVWYHEKIDKDELEDLIRDRINIEKKNLEKEFSERFHQDKSNKHEDYRNDRRGNKKHKEDEDHKNHPRVDKKEKDKEENKNNRKNNDKDKEDRKDGKGNNGKGNNSNNGKNGNGKDNHWNRNNGND